MNSLKPIDIYKTHAWQALEQKGRAPQEFYKNPISNIDYFRYLQNKKIPSEIEIYNLQKKHMNEHFSKYKQQLQQYISIINYDILNQGKAIPFNLKEQEIIQKIEEFFNYQLKTVNSNGEEVLRDIKKELKENKITNADFENYLKMALDLFNTLSQQPNKIVKDPIYRKKLKSLLDFINEGKKIILQEKGNTLYTEGLLKELGKINRVLKGRYLELATLQKMQEIINNSDVVAIDTSQSLSYHYNINSQIKNSNMKQSKSDILILTLRNNEKISLNDYIKKLEKENNKQYLINGLMDNFQGVGVQSKFITQKGNRIIQPFNRSSSAVTLQEAIDVKINQSSRTLKYLNLLTNEKYGNIAFYQTDKGNKTNTFLYNSLFDYAIAKNIYNIVGKENVLLATSKGIQFLDDYIYKNNYYIAATRNSVNINSLQKKIFLSVRRRKNI